MSAAEEQATRIVLRPLASPLPLGFLGLAGATFVLAGLQLGWVEPREGHQVALIVIAFTVPLQFAASVWGFLAHDATAATGMGLLSGIWLAIGLVTLSSVPGSTSDALGLFLLVASVAMLAPALAASAGKLVPAAVLTTAGVRFFLGGLNQLTGNDGWADAAGIVGLALCALAVYAAYAAELEDAWDRPVLPLGRRGRGERAVEDELPAQVAGLARKPGVRAQL
jgi:succinate-acetate transporter protein